MEVTSAMKSIYLYAAVMLSGAAVLAVELLGTRILGPFYGVSLFLWSALITVTLAALSLGYFLGGQRADRSATFAGLAWIIAGAGIWVVLIPFIKHPFLQLAEPLGLRGAVLLAAFVLFFPPLVLLGMVSPYAIRLKSSDIGHVGRTAGNLYAASTLAGVIAALVTGFYLIPSFGVNRLTWCAGAVLLGTAAAGLLIGKRSTLPPVVVTALFSAAILLSSSGRFAEGAGSRPGLLAVQQSPYGELRVFDNENGRHLLIDGGIHTLADTLTWDSYLHYVPVMDIPRYFFDRPGRALLVGLGGGSLLKQYSRVRWQVDAVEIDPAVIQLAVSHFGLRPPEGRVIAMDGRQYLATTRETYDVILLDAFGSSSIPFHLVTSEAFGLAASRLSPPGILALNVEALGWDDPIVATLAATLKEHFPYVLALPTEEPPDRLGNIVLLASQRPLSPLREPERNMDLDPDWRYGPGYQKVHAWDNRFTPETRGVRILTDDRNSVDLRAEAVNLASRRELHAYFGSSGGDW
jgi:spermidine synthase